MEEPSPLFCPQCHIRDGFRRVLLIRRIMVCTTLTVSFPKKSDESESPDPKGRNVSFRLFEKTAKNCGSKSLRRNFLILGPRGLLIQVYHFSKCQLRNLSESKINRAQSSQRTDFFTAKGAPCPQMWEIAKIYNSEKLELRFLCA